MTWSERHYPCKLFFTYILSEIEGSVTPLVAVVEKKELCIAKKVSDNNNHGVDIYRGRLSAVDVR